jgi:hypothetical protein
MHQRFSARIAEVRSVMPMAVRADGMARFLDLIDASRPSA